jgi:pilus assembly protein FimV
VTHRSGLAFVALLAVPLAAPAAGLGRLAVMSRTGEPLNTEIEIVSIRDKEGESLAARVAPPEVYRSAHIAPIPPVEALRAVIERKSDGRAVVKVTSTEALDQPVVNLLVELSWAGGSPVVRQYSFLLDTVDRKPPPVASAPPPAAADAAPPKPTEPTPPPAAPAQPSAAPAQPPAGPAQPSATTAQPSVALAQPPAAPAQPSTALAQPRSAPAEPPRAAAIPETGGTYAVQPGDSLLKIAQATKYDGVSFAQMVVAIHRANEDAFIGGDTSRLKSGRTLTIPGRDAVAAVNADEARQLVAVLRGQPEAGRARPAAAVRESGPAGDDIVARERALAESKDRASALEQTRDDLQRLIQAREREIADLEREFGAKGAKSQPTRKPAP